MKKSKAERLAAAMIRDNRVHNYNTSTHAIGDGLWSIEVHAEDNNEFLLELVGSNGTRDEADDLWGDFFQIRDEAEYMLSEWRAAHG